MLLHIYTNTLCTCRAVWCLVLNPSISLEFHLQQLLPAIFTCAVANQLSPPPPPTTSSSASAAGEGVRYRPREEDESCDHWAVRRLATEVIACCCHKYSAVFPDLQVISLASSLTCNVQAYMNILVIILTPVPRAEDLSGGPGRARHQQW